MMKSNLMLFMMNSYPIMLNILMLITMSFFSKNNKFNPINMILLLILLTTFMCLKINYLIDSWSSFSLFLIMIGGLMIIFMYIVSIASNELFHFNLKTLIMNLLKIIPIIIMIIMMSNNFLFETNNTNLWNSMIYNYSINFPELYSSYFCNNTMFIMNYLFYSMICIMNICYKFKSPLRQLLF